MKIADILSQVEHVKEGWSDSKSFDAWKDHFKAKRDEEDRKKLPDASPNRAALGKLQDQGLGRSMEELPSATIVGIPKK